MARFRQTRQERGRYQDFPIDDGGQSIELTGVQYQQYHYPTADNHKGTTHPFPWDALYQCSVEVVVHGSGIQGTICTNKQLSTIVLI